MLRGIFLILLFGCGLACPSPAVAERRVALVIGNGAYAEAPLRNPVNDARGIASVLRDLGFEVTLLENADRPAMQRASLEFGRKLSDDVAGLFYFAGHGMQVKGVNYLIPINAQVGSEEEVEVEAMDVNYILARMATARNKFNIVILDACRNNPFERSFRSSTSGLAAISAPQGTLIAYATAPGSVAADGHGASGLYTGELIAALKMPNLPLEQTFKRARAQVVTKSGGRQTPWESSSVIGDFVFRPQDGPTQSRPAPLHLSDDTTLWNAVKDSRDPADYRAYLETYPNGLYTRLAQSRIQTLAASRPAVVSPPQREAKAEPQSKPVAKASESQIASLSVSSDVAASRPSLDFVKANWPAIQAAVKRHFTAEANLAFYASLVQARYIGAMKIHAVGFYDAAVMTDTGVDLILLLQGETPSTILNDRIATFSQYMKYRFEKKNGELTIIDYAAVPGSALMNKDP